MDLLGLAGLPIQRAATPHRMGAALTYARRYALFTLVGIAGEDDLDAPDLVAEPSPAVMAAAETERHRERPANRPMARFTSLGAKAPLDAGASAALRDQLIAEVAGLSDGEDLALWAHVACRPRTPLRPTMPAPLRPLTKQA